MARIPGFHPGGPGSIPGVGDLPFSKIFQNLSFTVYIIYSSYVFEIIPQRTMLWQRAVNVFKNITLKSLLLTRLEHRNINIADD